MPIVRINTDGTVRIARKSGKDPIDVKPEELAQYNPALLADYNKFITEEKTLKSGGAVPDPTTEAKKDSAENIISQLEDLYFKDNKPLAFGVPGETGGRLPGLLKNIERNITPGERGSEIERLNTYKRTLESKRALLAKAAGDSGNLALQEQIMAGKGIPDESSTPGEAVELFKASRQSFGMKPGATTTKFEQHLADQEQQFSEESIVDPQPGLAIQEAQKRQQQQRQQLNPLEQLLMPMAKGPVGASAEALLSFLPEYKKAIKKSAQGGQVSLGEGVAAGGDVAATVLPFLKLAKLGLAGKAAIAGGIRGGTRDMSFGDRIKETGKEALIGGVLGGILRPGQTLGNIRTYGANQAAKKGITFSGKEIAKAGEEYAKRIPLAESISKKILPGLKKENLSPDQLISRLKEWGPLTYTKGGDPKATAQGEFMNILYGTARKQLANKAPLASMAQTGLSAGHKIKRIGGKVVGVGLLGGAAATAGGAALSRFFPGLFAR